MVLNPTPNVLRRERRETQRRWLYDDKAEAEVTLPQAQGCPGVRRGRKDPPLEPLEGAQPCNTLISDFCLPEL